MDTFMHLGLGIGLAGVAGVRAYFPLIIMGLITRFSESPAYRSPFTFFASVPVLLMLILIAAYELLSVRSQSNYNTPLFLDLGIKILAGAIIFAGVFAGFGIPVGLIVGGVLAALSYFIMVRLREEYKYTAKNQNDIGVGSEELVAISGTVLVLLIPWFSFVLWAILIFSLVRKFKTQSRYRLDPRAKSWR